jgi:hypothetical protein
MTLTCFKSLFRRKLQRAFGGIISLVPALFLLYSSTILGKPQDEHAMRFCKYRGVGDNLAEDRAVAALFNSFAIFSSRKNFNDVLDSKIEIAYPTPDQILQILGDSRLGSHATRVKGWVSDGSFTPEGNRLLKEAQNGLNEIFDSYPIFSFSRYNVSIRASTPFNQGDVRVELGA